MHQQILLRTKKRKDSMNNYREIPGHDMKILMGDLNAQIGADRSGWKKVMGRGGDLGGLGDGPTKI